MSSAINETPANHFDSTDQSRAVVLGDGPCAGPLIKQPTGRSDHVRVHNCSLQRTRPKGSLVLRGGGKAGTKRC